MNIYTCRSPGLYQTIHDLLTLGFRDQAVQMTGANYGLSLILTEAIDGTYPDLKIAYDRVKTSIGLLLNVEGLARKPLAGYITAIKPDDIEKLTTVE